MSVNNVLMSSLYFLILIPNYRVVCTLCMIRYYGSDGMRSPYHFMRNPGEPVYDGVPPH